MPVYKDKKSGTWYISLYYPGNDGKLVRTSKHGFRLKSEALAWEKEFFAAVPAISNILFSELCEHYKRDHFPRVKDITANGLSMVIDHKLLPVFGSMKLKDITPSVIIKWQNKLLSEEKCNLDGVKLKHSYINKITSILGAIMGFACRYYGLTENPVDLVDKLSEVGEGRMNFWTADEYSKFASVFETGSLDRTCFDTLYWSGIREGELMALTWNDINLEKDTITISKTMHLKAGQSVVTPPKTIKANRTVQIPKKLSAELKLYKSLTVDPHPENQVFPVAPWYLYRHMRSGCKKAGMTPIRIHDLRHSHVSLLIHLGFSAVDIAERMGHESTDITYHYAHLFPSEQDRIAEELDKIRKGGNK